MKARLHFILLNYQSTPWKEQNIIHETKKFGKNETFAKRAPWITPENSEEQLDRVKTKLKQEPKS